MKRDFTVVIERDEDGIYVASVILGTTENRLLQCLGQHLPALSDSKHIIGWHIPGDGTHISPRKRYHSQRFREFRRKSAYSTNKVHSNRSLWRTASKNE